MAGGPNGYAPCMAGVEMAFQVLFAESADDAVTLDVVFLEEIAAIPEVPVGAPAVLHLRSPQSPELDVLVAATLGRWAAAATVVDAEVTLPAGESRVTMRDGATVVRLELESVEVLVA